jgi:hypothetical protein
MDMRYTIKARSNTSTVALRVVGKKKGKGKVVPVLNLIKHYAMKTYGGVDV